MKKIAKVIYWKGTKKNVREFIKEYQVCQCNKYDATASPSLLQPLPIPNFVWSDISLDFLEDLPKSQGKDSILVVMDRLSKYAHFIPLAHPFTAIPVAQLFLDNVYRLYGVPASITFDRDRFLNHFWKELFRLLGTRLRMSIAYHPQIDGQTEAASRTLGTYLRCMSRERPKD